MFMTNRNEYNKKETNSESPTRREDPASRPEAPKIQLEAPSPLASPYFDAST
jgi:hypothetical protein